MQHMQSFSKARLAKLIEDHGFKVEICTNMDIEKFKLGRVKYGIKRVIAGLAELAGIKEARKEKTPNLVALASKI